MKILDLDQQDFLETLDLQKQLLEKRANGEIEDTLILVEHPPVYTIGRDRPDKVPTSIKVPKLGTVPVVEVERGGKITFHGPGQIVGYPIFALPGKDVGRYLSDLARTLSEVVSEKTHLPARPAAESLKLEQGQLQTGVWIHDRKIVCIGIAVKKWVSYHGFALNVSTDLSYFKAIEPCGFPPKVITSVKKELGARADISALNINLKQALAEAFSELSGQYETMALNPEVSEKDKPRGRILS